MYQPHTKTRVRARARPRDPQGRVTMVQALSSVRVIPHRPSRGRPLPSSPTPLVINDDILIVIAQHTEYHIMLALLAAHPSPQFARSLYNHNSDFWCKRLGAQTGYGCLVQEDGTGRRAMDAPWTPKMQHDALTVRSGHLVLTTSYHSAPTVIATMRRVKAVVNASVRSPGYYSLAVAALWEDGTVRTLATTLMNGDSEAIVDAIEDDDRWIAATAVDYIHPDQPLQIGARAVNTSPLPRMKTMIVYDEYDGIFALDYEGIIWRMVATNIHKTKEHGAPTMARVSDRKSIGRIIHMGTIQANLTSRTSGAAERMIVVTNEQGKRYILHTVTTRASVPENSHVDIYTPVYIPLDRTILSDDDDNGDDVAYDATLAAAMVGSYRRPQTPEPGQDWGNKDDDRLRRLLYPSAPYILMRIPDVKTLIPGGPEDPSLMDRDAMGPLQGDVKRNGSIVYIAPPFVATSGLLGPTPTEGDATTQDIIDLRGPPSSSDVVYLVPLVPKWTLGLTRYISIGRIVGDDYGARAVEYYAQESPFLECIPSAYIMSVSPIAAILRSDGSVDIVSDARWMKGATRHITVDDIEYDAMRLDLSKAVGQDVVAMVHINRSLGEDEELYGIGV